MRSVQNTVTCTSYQEDSVTEDDSFVNIKENDDCGIITGISELETDATRESTDKI